jgi:LysM repeat protein
VTTLIQYEIQPGDTLAGIANYYGVSVEAILAANSNISQENLPEGVEITIPISTKRMMLQKLFWRRKVDSSEHK